MEIPSAGRWQRRKGWAVGAALAVAFTVAMLLSPGVLSVSSARTTGVVNTPVKDAKCKVGAAPADPAYDPVNHEIYVPNSQSNNISIVKAPCTVAATIKLPSGSDPTAAAFDPQDNYVYVTDVRLNAVYVISGTKIVKTLHGFAEPLALVYDPCLTSMIVTNYAGDNLTGVIGTGFFGNAPRVPTGAGPSGIDYNPSGWLSVANALDANVTTIDACSLASDGSVTVGSNPEGVAYDPAFGSDFVTNFGSRNVTLLPSLVGLPFPESISGFNEPSSATWSQAKLAVYVTNYGSGGLWAIGGTLDSISIVQKIDVAKGIYGSAYDDANDDIYVTDFLTGIHYVYST